MPRKIQPTYTSAPHVIVALGDSNTYNNQFPNTRPEQYYPGLLATSLTALGCNVLVRNWGISGNTTANMLARVAVVTRLEVPALFMLYGGVNDVGSDTTVASASSSTVFTVQAGKGAGFVAGTYVLVNGVSRKILSIATDTITLTTALSGTPSAGQTVKMDTQVNLLTIGQTVATLGVTRTLIVGQQYLNLAVNGETPSVQYAAYQTLRGIQSAVATSLGAAYANVYTYVGGKVTDGTITAGNDVSIHVAVGNGHYNATGQSFIGQAALATIQAQSGWVAALSA